MKVLRTRRDDGNLQLCFNDNGKFLVSDSLGSNLDTQEILNEYANFNNLDLHEIESPKRFSVPLPFERLFLPAVNFRAHGAESKMVIPKEPYFFLKFKSSLVSHECTVHIPPNIKQADYEGEIGIVIGKKGKYISKEDAMDYVFGYTVVDDVSLRDYQFREEPRFGKNWVMGKQFDGALPTGPWVVTKDEIKKPEFSIQTKVNDELRQDGSTEDMIFSVSELVSYLSEVNTLVPGDLLTTGTPAGVGAHTGGRFLKEGDRVDITVSEVGTLTHYISFK